MADRRYGESSTVYIGGEWLVEPTMRELEWALMRSGLR
jgi:mycoredoxin